VRRVDVTVGELVVDGFDGVDADALQAATAAELERLLAGRSGGARPAGEAGRLGGAVAAAVRDEVTPRLPGSGR
jgi:hypothetical protein